MDGVLPIAREDGEICRIRENPCHWNMLTECSKPSSPPPPTKCRHAAHGPHFYTSTAWTLYCTIRSGYQTNGTIRGGSYDLLWFIYIDKYKSRSMRTRWNTAVSKRLGERHFRIVTAGIMPPNYEGEKNNRYYIRTRLPLIMRNNYDN